MTVTRVEEATTIEDGKRSTGSVKASSDTAAQEKVVSKVDDEQELPKNNLPLVFFSLLLATFLVRP